MCGPPPSSADEQQRAAGGTPPAAPDVGVELPLHCLADIRNCASAAGAGLCQFELILTLPPGTRLAIGGSTGAPGKRPAGVRAHDSGHHGLVVVPLAAESIAAASEWVGAIWEAAELARAQQAEAVGSHAAALASADAARAE